jgi:hypothetical protein
MAREGHRRTNRFAVEDRVRRLSEQLIPLFDGANRMLNRNLKAIKELRQGQVPAIAIGRADHVTVTNRPNVRLRPVTTELPHTLSAPVTERMLDTIRLGSISRGTTPLRPRHHNLEEDPDGARQVSPPRRIAGSPACALASSIRSGLIKRVFGLTKVPYRGLAKNRHRFEIGELDRNPFIEGVSGCGVRQPFVVQGPDGSRDGLTGRSETFAGDGCRYGNHHAKVHDPDDPGRSPCTALAAQFIAQAGELLLWC